MQQSPELTRRIDSERVNPTPAIARIQGEVVRKSLHLLIGLVPVLASVDLVATFVVLALGTLFYAFAETSRLQGMPIPVVSDLVLIASRDKDRNGFVLGPVTLSLGAMLSLLLYPLPAASIAIFALAFGDAFASLMGTLVRGPRFPFLQSKTLSGSISCFLVVFLVTLSVTHQPSSALVIAAAATILEGIPAGNFDNIIIPFGVGLAAWALGIG